LGFDVGDRTDAALPWLWRNVPEDYRSKPVDTDGWGAYARFFASVASGRHTVCDKGSGRTSRIEAFNNKCRQRQSGLVRRSCGSWAGITDDTAERFIMFAERRNKECSSKWEARQNADQQR
jgi:IS1 family transposase